MQNGKTLKRDNFALCSAERSEAYPDSTKDRRANGMKNVFMLGVTVLLLAGVPLVSSGGPVGGTAKPVETVVIGEGFTLGLEGNYISERTLSGWGGEIDIESLQGFLKGAWILEESPISLSLRVGAADATLKNGLLEYEFDPAFAWGVSGAVELYENRRSGAIFCGEVQYFAFDLEEKNAGATGNGDWQEWQVSLFLTRKVPGVFVPYLGIKYSEAEINFKQRQPSLDEADSIGVFAGTHINFGEDFFINLEARAVDETAFTSSINYRF